MSSSAAATSGSLQPVHRGIAKEERLQIACPLAPATGLGRRSGLARGDGRAPVADDGADLRHESQETGGNLGAVLAYRRALNQPVGHTMFLCSYRQAHGTA